MAPSGTLFQKKAAESGFSKEQENFLIQMNETGIRDVKNAISRSMDDRFTAYGFPIKDPISIQKDQAFVTWARGISESIYTKIIMVALLGTGIAGLLSKAVK